MSRRSVRRQNWRQKGKGAGRSAWSRVAVCVAIIRYDRACFAMQKAIESVELYPLAAQSKQVPSEHYAVLVVRNERVCVI